MMNPPGACNRVFNVSMGKRETSTAVPANPPDNKATAKDVLFVDIVVVVVVVVVSLFFLAESEDDMTIDETEVRSR